MKVNKIEAIDFENIYKILSSGKITDAQKTDFIRKNLLEIKKIMITKISSQEFKTLMQNRAIIKFRPLKNSFTKKGDKILLAHALEVKPSDIAGYIKKTSEAIEKMSELSFLPPDKLEMIKTYVYRHGSKEEVVNFLDYELTKADDKIQALYTTLRYYNNGVADYFIRPIHRMDNKTLIKIYKIINKHISQAKENGITSEAESEKISKWALVQIYKIQNNSRFINAIKTRNILN